jgi:hypothetical protein
MSDFVYDHMNHVLCVLILLSRIGDIGTTYLVTPHLVLEANPLVRWLGWRFALLSLVICFVPYYSVSAGVAVLVPSLMVSASNAGKIWVARTLGEHEYQAFMLRIAAASRLRYALAGLLLSSSFVVLVGTVLVLLYPDPTEEYAWWFGVGIITYGVVIAFHGTVALIRLFKQARVAVGVSS